MGKDIGIIYKHSKYQLWTLSINAPVLSYSAFKTSSSIELTIIYVPSVRDKKQTNSVLCYENYIQNNSSIKNIYNIQPCETQRKIIIAFQPIQLQIITNNVFLPHQWIFKIYKQLRNYLQWVKNRYVFRTMVNCPGSQVY